MERTCKTCRAYWKRNQQCRRHAPKPTIGVNIKQHQQFTMWLHVDGEGCDEWIPKSEMPPAEVAEVDESEE